MPGYPMSIEKLAFFLSTEQECSYLPGLKSASVFADPNSHMNTATYSILIDHGFRRSGNHVYRPHCPNCNECKPTRVSTKAFQPNKNQKRVWKRNADLDVLETKAEFKAEHFDLYKKYMHTRHEDGAMDHDDPARYFEFLRSSWCDTHFVEFRLNNQLVAVAVTDIVANGLSALYTFFDPDYSQRSLGTYAILWQIHRAAELNKPWLYLGYWIKNCDKMRYKNQFKPMEIWQNDKWIDLEDISNE